MRWRALAAVGLVGALGVPTPGAATEAPPPAQVTSIADPLIAFTSTRYSGRPELMVMTPLGQRQRRLTQWPSSLPSEATVQRSNPDWSPNRGRLVFASGGATQFQGSTSVQTIAANGTDERTVDSGSQVMFDGTRVGLAGWVPGGRRITYVRTSVARFERSESLLLLNLRTGTGRTIESIGFGRVGAPAWAPDGHRLVTGRIGRVSSSVEVSELRVHDLAGGEPTSLTTSDRFDYDWSSDGALIVFARGDELYTIEPDGTDETLLTTGAGPRWSPDGSTVAFTRGGQIHVIGRDGTGEVPLTSAGQNADPNWSGDGSKIAFSSDRDGNWEIYLMDADGGRQRNLTRRPGADLEPDWRPRAVAR